MAETYWKINIQSIWLSTDRILIRLQGKAYKYLCELYPIYNAWLILWNIEYEYSSMSASTQREKLTQSQMKKPHLC